MSQYQIFTPQKFVVRRPENSDEASAVTTGLRGPVGPEGPVGPPGPPGSSGGHYTHTQTTLSTSWVMNHGLGFYPNVDAFDDNGRKMDVSYIHHSLNQTEIQLLTPRTGTAILS